MSLMVSVAGIRGIVGKSLTPLVLTTYTQAYATWLYKELHRQPKPNTVSRAEVPKVILGRDTRPTGKIISDFVQGVLVQAGCNVINLGVVTTPTVELAVTEEDADGGIIITASHNPVEWNALKLLNALGEFLTPAQGTEVVALAESKDFFSATWNNFGMAIHKDDALDRHIEKVLNLPLIHPERIAARNYKVVIDAVNGAGSGVMPKLLEALGAKEVIKVACNGSGLFPHGPEPIEENLTETMGITAYNGADFGVVVDPDVDRIAFICEDGTLFGEEYTLVACADYILKHRSGAVVNNLSSSRALEEIAAKYGAPFHTAKVGEANVVEVMKQVGAIIGGEGNGGVILPELHYGRDALVGLALFMQAFADWQTDNHDGKLSLFKKSFPEYHIAKHRIELSSGIDADTVLMRLQERYAAERMTTIDGVKIDFAESWVHLRKSNTEPIIRIYAEAKTKTAAEKLARDFGTELIELAARSVSNVKVGDEIV
ncbi:MAG: phosphoglucosamine mutase [Rhizobacter sp.]|nr:phosphoglucosamine mutase [Chlorobiales bacterium]